MKKLLSYITILFCILFNSTFAEEIKEETVIIKNNEPLVSVIMPVYNAEEFLDKSVSSVINQTYKNLEILLIDDCSTDNSYNILKEYANKDNRIKLFHNEQNKHVSATRNVGIKNATGKYLYFIDSDDFIDNDYIEHLVKTAEKENADIVVNTNMYSCKNKRKKIHDLTRQFRTTPKDDYKILANKFFPSVCNRLFKRELQIEYNILFPDGIKYLEDGYFNVLYFSVSNNVSFISPNSYYYRVIENSNSVMSNLKQLSTIRDMLFVLKNEYKFLKENNILDKGYFTDLAGIEKVFFDKVYINDNKLDNKTIELLQKYYLEIRKLILTIQCDLLNNNLLYTNQEKMVLKSLNKFKNYNDYKEYYNKKVLVTNSVIVFLTTILIVLVLYAFYILYKVYIDVKKYKIFKKKINKTTKILKNLDN